MHLPLFINRRKQILAQPFPDDWLSILNRNVRQYTRLTFEEKDALRDIVKVLVHEKNWEGCKGLDLTDEIRVTIAGQAAIPLIAIEHDYYSDVESILVYPFAYVAVERTAHPGNVIRESPSYRAGEAWSRGPIILSWPDALAGGRNESDGHNVVIHEFAHKLDFRDGSFDGVPHLGSQQEYDRWAEVMSAEYHQLVQMSETGQATLLNHYGATNPAEFFAVVTECFFERPIELRHGHPALYDVFSAYYRQDPASRITP